MAKTKARISYAVTAVCFRICRSFVFFMRMLFVNSGPICPYQFICESNIFVDILALLKVFSKHKTFGEVHFFLFSCRDIFRTVQTNDEGTGGCELEVP